MIVETNLGAVRGVEKKSAVSENKYFSFLGIPYAKPPIGELRFAPPVPVEKWEGVYDATRDRNMCIQAETIHSFKLRGSEDCLYLNIHTPQVNPTTLKPVMFYIHGGGFLQGTGNSYSREADYLIDHDVVVVTINYRLHILGFLNLNLPECPGNAGLKDQLMALLWVKEHIHMFGGDPNNITIFGTSAGGTSVQCFMLSPKSKGLFQKAIFQSGCIESPCSILRDHMKLAFRVGRKLGYQGDDPRCILQRLKAVSSEDLLKLVFSILKDVLMEYPMSGFPPFFQPSIEIFKNEAFLPDDPVNLILTAEPIPCIVGYNEIEASIMYAIIPDFIREDPLKAFPCVIKNNFDIPESDLATISENIKSHYFGNDDDADTKLQNLMRMISHVFVYPFHRSYQYLESSDTPPFLYHFIHYDKDEISSATGIRRRLKGAFHSDEENYLFVQKKPPIPVKMNGTEKKVRQNMCSLWTNFAKTGNPTENMEGPTWTPSTTNAPCYLQIGEDYELIDGKPDEKEIAILRGLLQGAEKHKF